MVGDFGDGTDGAAGGADWVGLAEGDGGWDTFDAVDSGAIHTLEELAGVGAKSFRVAALAFGVEGIEGEGGFARAGGAGQDVKHPEGQVKREVFEIILAGAFNADKT